MNSMLDLRNKTKFLLRDQKPDQNVLEEALPMCKQLWDEFDQTNNLWDAWQYAKCLYDLKRYSEAEVVCKKIYNKFNEESLDIQQQKAFNYIKNLYARIINDGYFKTIKEKLTNEDVHVLLDKAILLGLLIKHELNSPLEFCSFRAIQKAKKVLPTFPAEKILKILEPLNASILSEETYVVNLENGKNIEMQSRKEEFYSFKTKALLALKRYEECIDCCHEALDSISQFHFGNEIWIEERFLTSIANLGNVEEAIIRAEKLILQKDSWFLLYELAKLYLLAGRKIDAELFLYRAAYSRDPLEMKVKLLETIGDFLTENGDEIFAQKHYILIKKIREKNDWKIASSLQDKIRSDENVNEKELKREWLNRIYNLLKVKEGFVSRFNSSGKNGFIKYDGGSVFFSVKNFLGRSDKLRENDKVKFVLTKSFDHKKQEESVEANYITLINY